MIYWDPDPDLFIIPILHWPIKWYGLFFALGFAIGFPIFQGILYRYLLLADPNADVKMLKNEALKVTDKITIYMVIATAVGARLGHFIFYEKPEEYLSRPWEILQIWKGGLASHGAAVGIIVGLCLFSRWSKKVNPGLISLRLLDLISVPAALAGAFIRLGNLMNQEILGTATNMPWGFVFGHPVDGSGFFARHPVQLYEAFFYFAVFLLLWRLAFRPSLLMRPGRLIGLFLILVFSFRFFIEYFKLEQSQLLSASHGWTMGQWLSIPLVLAGAFLFFRSEMASTK
jgi:prolipoprotein diacylglyceryl transferase